MQPISISGAHAPRVMQKVTQQGRPVPLLQGTLDLLILRALQVNEANGSDVARWINENSGGVFQVKSGSLFPSLHRLERQKFVRCRWAESKQRRWAKVCQLTRTGREHLEAELTRWKLIVVTMDRLIFTTDGHESSAGGEK